MIGEPVQSVVAVIAGTPYDTALGIRLLAERGVPGRPYPLAGSPDEQDLLQYRHPEKLNTLFTGCLRDARDRGVRTALVFCNSLAAVVRDDADSGIDVISPVGIYQSIPPEYRRLMVLAGNAQAAVGFERSVASLAGERRVLAVCDQDLVRAIETGDPAAGLLSSRTSGLLRIAEQRGTQAIVLACTHFTGISSEIKQLCSIPVIDVGTELVRLATEASLQQAADNR
jgi:glutamate racemase